MEICWSFAITDRYSSPRLFQQLVWVASICTGSLLPRHRGAAPVQWSVLAGDVFAGVSVIHMTPGLDAGPILTSASTRIHMGEDAGELEARLSQLGVEPTLLAIEMLERDDHHRSLAQDRSYATRAPRLKKSDGELDWTTRALARSPTPRFETLARVFTHLELPDGKSLRVIVHRATPIESVEVSKFGEVGSLLLPADGTSINLSWSDQAVAVIARDGVMALESVQPSGKRAMSGAEFMRGYAEHAGVRFRVPESPRPVCSSPMMALSTEPERTE
jgi:methionyl-tRNA formyltransferase